MYKNLLEFFEGVHIETRLPSGVFDDLKVKPSDASCRALGLISNLVQDLEKYKCSCFRYVETLPTHS